MSNEISRGRSPPRGTDRRGVFGGAAAETAGQSVPLVTQQTDNDEDALIERWEDGLFKM